MALLTVTSEALFPVFTLYTIAFWHGKGILSRESDYICKTVKSSGKISGRNEDFSDIYISIMSFYRIRKIKLIVRRKATKNQKRTKVLLLNKWMHKEAWIEEQRYEASRAFLGFIISWAVDTA